MTNYLSKTIINHINCHKKNDASITNLEYELLVAASINKPRSFIFAHPNYQLSEQEVQQFHQLLKRKKQEEPIAYITGKKEFWSLTLAVNKNVLVPRPETELLIEVCLEACKNIQSPSILELGTGSGALSIALQHELPNAQIVATDISYAALNIAKKNAKQYHFDSIQFIQSNWLESVKKAPLFDIVISNPPYIANNDPHLSQKSLQFEPIQALISGDDGLDAIREIIKNTPEVLKTNGHLLLEHGYNQQPTIITLMQESGFTKVFRLNDLNHWPRVVMGKLII